jgi:hypothetical protein
MHSSPPLLVMDYIGPAVGAAVFVLVMSVVKEPTRRTFNAILVAGASGVYLSGGFGRWELLYPALAIPVASLGLRSYRFIALAWLMHSCWDIVHHFWGNPIWPFMPTSSFGCMMFDALIAIWFLADAPSIFLKGLREGGLTRYGGLSSGIGARLRNHATHALLVARPNRAPGRRARRVRFLRAPLS